MLINAKNLQLAFGMAPLLDGVNFILKARERVGLIGRNGEGKSTLLKVLTQQIVADEGELVFLDGLRTAVLEQEVPNSTSGTVYEVVASGKKEALDAVAEYEQLTGDADFVDNEQKQNRVNDLMALIDMENAWDVTHQVHQIIDKLSLEANQNFMDLSGGRKRRVMLAKALLNKPDILFLDEPTNHLDVESIHFLEDFLQQYEGAIFFISHDRSFIDALATRIIELDRGQLSSYNGNFAYYTEKKKEQLESEAKENSEFDKRLAQEEVWIRQGIKARRTRNEGRVRALERMREQRKERRNTIGNAKMAVSTGNRSGKLIVEATNVGYCWGKDASQDEWLFKNLNTLIMRGDKLGIIGPNGAGKTTLIKLLLDQLQPTEGELKFGHNLEIAYLDQLRSQLNEEDSIIDNIREGSDFIEVNGKQKHVMSYMQDFLFSPERARTPVKALSGGEKNRVLLAKLFTKSINVLVLDEPTNDLDIDTLELLESLLVDFDGTLLMISHDRTFVNNVVTGTLAFEPSRTGIPTINEYVGGYEDWLRQSPYMGQELNAKVDERGKTLSTQTIQDKSIKTEELSQTNPEIKAVKKKLSYNEQRELKAIPELIDQLEQEIVQINTQLQQPDIYSDAEKAKQLSQTLTKKQTDLDTAVERWAELED